MLPTVGGQTALNLAVDLHKAGVLAEYGVELIGASVEAVEIAEDRELFKEAMTRGRAAGRPKRRRAIRCDEALAIVKDTGFPAIIRPSFTLGGTGGGIAYNIEEFRDDRRARARPIADAPGTGRGERASAGKNSSSKSCATATTTS